MSDETLRAAVRACQKDRTRRTILALEAELLRTGYDDPARFRSLGLILREAGLAVTGDEEWKPGKDVQATPTDEERAAADAREVADGYPVSRWRIWDTPPLGLAVDDWNGYEQERGAPWPETPERRRSLPQKWRFVGVVSGVVAFPLLRHFNHCASCDCHEFNWSLGHWRIDCYNVDDEKGLELAYGTDDKFIDDDGRSRSVCQSIAPPSHFRPSSVVVPETLLRPSLRRLIAAR